MFTFLFLVMIFNSTVIIIIIIFVILIIIMTITVTQHRQGACDQRSQFVSTQISTRTVESLMFYTGFWVCGSADADCVGMAQWLNEGRGNCKKDGAYGSGSFDKKAPYVMSRTCWDLKAEIDANRPPSQGYVAQSPPSGGGGGRVMKLCTVVRVKNVLCLT
jgi:hypothetical protein